MFSSWNLKDNTSSQVSQTYLSILDDFNNGLDSSFDILFLQAVLETSGTVPKTPTGITFTFMFFFFSALARSSRLYMLVSDLDTKDSFPDMVKGRALNKEQTLTSTNTEMYTGKNTDLQYAYAHTYKFTFNTCIYILHPYT